MINDIIKLYKSFNRYKDNTDLELYYHINQSINNNQYKVFKDKEIYGFVNWAFVDKKTEDYFLKTGIIKDWNCGDIMLHIDFVANKNIKYIMNWLKNNSVETLGLNKTIHWVRLNKENKIRTIVEQNTKDNWLWVA